MNKILIHLCILLPTYAWASDPVLFVKDRNKETFSYVVPVQGKSDIYNSRIGRVFHHICSPENNMFYREIYRTSGLYAPLPPSLVPQNKAVWDNTKTSWHSGIVVNKQETYPPLPSFECNIAGNTIKIVYDYGVLANGRPIHIKTPYLSQFSHERLYSSSRKVYAIHINDKQITSYDGNTDVDTESMDSTKNRTPIIEYLYSIKKKQYYISIYEHNLYGYFVGRNPDIAIPDHVITESTKKYDLSYYDQSPAFDDVFTSVTTDKGDIEYKKSTPDFSRKYHIKVYSGIVQPDGTVSP